MPVESQLGAAKVQIAGNTRTMRRHFQTDLSAAQRWPLNSLASASTEPLSSSGSPPSSSPLALSDRFSLGPAFSSVVVVTGLEIHNIRRSEAPGLSDDTSAVTSMLSVRPSAG